MSYSWSVDIAVATFAEAVRFIAAQPGGADRLLTQHRPDERGRCQGCTTPGTGTPHRAWPCPIAVLADNARLSS